MKYYGIVRIISNILLLDSMNSMNHLNKSEKKYLEFSEFVHEIVDLFILIYQKAKNDQLNQDDMMVLFRKNWELSLCGHIISKLSKHMKFIEIFSNECLMNGDNIMLEAIEMDKKLVNTIVGILETLHSTKFNIYGLTSFIHEQSKKRDMHKYLVDNIETVLPDPPKDVPMIKPINDIIEHLKLFGLKNETEKLVSKSVEDNEKSNKDLIEF